MVCEDYEPEDRELGAVVVAGTIACAERPPDGSLDRLANHLAVFITSERASHCVQRIVPGNVRRALVVLLVAAARSLTSRPVALP